jgi:hypothetical protein
MGHKYNNILETIGNMPLFADVPADMTSEELTLSQSTPNYHLAAAE